MIRSLQSAVRIPPPTLPRTHRPQSAVRTRSPHSYPDPAPDTPSAVRSPHSRSALGPNSEMAHVPSSPNSEMAHVPSSETPSAVRTPHSRSALGPNSEMVHAPGSVRDTHSAVLTRLSIPQATHDIIPPNSQTQTAVPTNPREDVAQAPHTDAYKRQNIQEPDAPSADAMRRPRRLACCAHATAQTRYEQQHTRP